MRSLPVTKYQKTECARRGMEVRKDFLSVALRPRTIKVNADLRSQVSKFCTLKICKV